MEDNLLKLFYKRAYRKLFLIPIKFNPIEIL